LLTIGQPVHIDTADHVSMSDKPTFSAPPHSALGFVPMLACRTLAAGSSFRASEALDAGLCALLGEIVDILAVFPLRHALIVMAPLVLLPHAVWIADEEGADLMFNAEVDHLPRGFMPQVAHPPLDTTRHSVLRPLQFPPTSRVLLTPHLFLGQLPVPHVALALEAADTAA
jgi:hypothetical protein